MVRPAERAAFDRILLHVVDTLFQAVRRDNDMIEIIHPAMVDYNATG